MDIGFGAPVAGAWASPRNLTEFARRAERLGYRSLWTLQRLLVPADTAMAPVYRSVLDPMVSLGYAAAVTSAIRLGVATLCHPFVSPLLLAKQAATVDVLSGGRLDLGVGSGWLPAEFTGSGASMDRRGPRTEEYVAALRALWTSEAGFRGKFFEIPPGRQDPPPVQRPGPPVLLGGMSRPAMERAGRIADGWVTASSADLSKIAEAAKGPGDRGGGRARAGADHLPRRGARGQTGGVRRAAAAAVRKLRADQGGHGMAGQLRCHRGVLRPELGPAGRRPGSRRGQCRAAGQ